MAERLLNTLRKVNRGVAIVIGLMLLACALFVLLDIVLRQFGSSFGGTDEISGYAMAIATSWGMAFTMLELGHVRIDLLRSRLTNPWRVFMDLFSMLVLASTITVIAWRCWPVVAGSLENQSTANTPLETPLILVQLPWFAGWAWFALTAWVTLAVAAALVVHRRYAEAESAIGAFAEEDSSV